MESEKILTKLFILSETNSWEDKFTGFLYLLEADEFDPEKPNVKIILTEDSETDDPIHEFIIKSDIKYSLSQDSLIMWEDDDGVDYALSFQNREFCDLVYQTLNKSLNQVSSTAAPSEEINGDDSYNFVDFPPFQYENLDEIHKIFTDSSNTPRRIDVLIESFGKLKVMPNLVDIFHTCESLEDMNGLYKLYEIFRLLLTTNKYAILECLLNVDTVLDVIGILEYNPQLPTIIKHRENILNSKNVEIVKISNDGLKTLINHVYRLEYLQQFLFPVNIIFDDRSTFLTTYVFYRRSELMENIFDDDTILPEVFSLFSAEGDDERVINALKFVVEICNFLKILTSEQKIAFMSKVVEQKIMESLIQIKIIPQVIQYITEILLRIVDSHTEYVREHLALSNTILLEMINIILCDTESNVAYNSVQIFKVLLEIPTNQISNPSSSSTSFLTCFYGEPATKLFQRILDYSGDLLTGIESLPKALVVECLIEILQTCIQFHGFHIKNFIFKRDLLNVMTVLINSKYPAVAHGFVRIIRQVVVSLDDFYHQYLSSELILDKILESLVKKHKRNDLMNSAIIDLFETVRVDSKQHILKFIGRNLDIIKSITYSSTFKMMVNKYQKSLEPKKNNYTRFQTAAIVNSLRESNENSWIENEKSDEEANNCVFNDDIDMDLPSVKSKTGDVDDGVILSKPVSQPLFKISLKRPLSPTSDDKANLNKLVAYSDDDEDSFNSHPMSEEHLFDVTKRPKNCT